MDEVQGKVAVITGGASGIGLAMARRFTAEGMKVLLADIEEGALDDAAAELQAAGADVRTAVCDVSSAEDMDVLGQSVIDAFGEVHVVCNNAGVGSGGLMQTLTVKDWEWCLGVNLWGVIHGIRVFLPLLVEQDEGHIVNTASVAGLFAAPFLGPYSASKAAVVSISETLFNELAMSQSQVGVSVLCPSWVNTRIHESHRNRPGHLQNVAEGADGVDGDGADPLALGDVLKGIIESGLPPAEVAEQVLHAVLAKQFYILTHPDSVEAVRARADAIIGNGTPPFLMPQ
jgi:NAD(P)-dependent dehydrogenase (short-subunit alcohol dehydrogenase family)